VDSQPLIEMLFDTLSSSLKHRLATKNTERGIAVGYFLAVLEGLIVPYAAQ
jgi:hypothetical protein